MEKRNQAAKLLIGLVIVIFAVLLVGGVVGGKNLVFHLDSTSQLPLGDVVSRAVEAVKDAAAWAVR